MSVYGDAFIFELYKQCEISLNTSINASVKELNSYIMYGFIKSWPSSLLQCRFVYLRFLRRHVLALFCVYFVNHLLAPEV